MPNYHYEELGNDKRDHAQSERADETVFCLGEWVGATRAKIKKRQRSFRPLRRRGGGGADKEL